MTRHMTTDDPMHDLEDRAGVEPVAVLLARRDEIVERLAVLRPKYGPANLFDNLRKIELTRIAMRLRTEYVARGEKYTETKIDDEAHASDEYAAFVALGTTEGAEYFRLEQALKHIDYRIARGDSLLYYVGREPK